MRKLGLLTVLFMLLAGCKTTPQTTAPATQAALPQTQTAAGMQQETISSPKQETPSQTQPQPSAEETAPQPKQETLPADANIQKNPAAAQTQENPPEPKVLPKDTPVFEDEDLIDTKGRLLNPYAYLTPDASARTGAPWDGEQLKYGIYYTFIKAGTAYIRNRGVVDIDGRLAYLIQTTAFSATVIDAFFKVRDINQSWIDTQTFYSLGYGQSVREGSYKRDEWVNFAPQENRYYGQIQKKDPAPREINGELTAPVADFLSALYFVRAQKLEVGKDIVFDIVNREKQYPLIVKVLRKEKIKTPAGKFNCIVVEPQLRGEGIFVSKGKSLAVWLTDDEYRMPVKMKTEVFIGSVSATLLEYKRL